MRASRARRNFIGALLLLQASIVSLVTAGPVARGLLLVPADEAQREATGLVREVYGDALSKAGTPAEKVQLAGRLLDESNQAVEPANRYALLAEARRLAVEAGDLQAALAAIEHMTGTFDVDPVRIQASTLWQLSAKTKDSEVYTAIAMKAQELADAAVEQGHFDVAEKLIGFAVENARSARDGKLVHAIVAHGEKIALLREQYDEVQRALETLETKPLDPAANRAAGRWRCFLQNRWDEGVAMLVLGDDAALSDLAKRDLLSPQTAAERLVVADGWWEFAAQCDEQLAARVKRRAGLWYARALPALTGLDQQRAQVRLKEAGPVAGMANASLAESMHLAGRETDPSIESETTQDDPTSPVTPGRHVLSGPNVVKLTEQKPVRARVGWDGFWVNRAPDGSWPLIGPDFEYCPEFLYAHAPSRLAYVLPRGMLSFTAVGYCVCSRSVRFLVVADGTTIFESPKAGIVDIRVDLPPRTKVLELVVDDIGDKGRDQSFWCVPMLHRLKIEDLEEKRGASVSMTTLPPAAASVGSGKLWINRMERPDQPIPVLYQGGGRCDEFFYAHPESEAVFDLPQGADRFAAVGYAMLSQSVMFRVLVDGKLMYESPKAGIVPIDIAIPEGAKQLTLETDPLGSGFADHAFWCYPRLRVRQ